MKRNEALRTCITLLGVFVLISTFAITMYAKQATPSLTSTPFPCGTCKGNKTISDIYGRKITCPKCKGTGNEPSQEYTELKATPFPDTSKDCTVCHGEKGWKTTYGWNTCSHCHGTGKEPNKNR